MFQNMPILTHLSVLLTLEGKNQFGNITRVFIGMEWNTILSSYQNNHNQFTPIITIIVAITIPVLSAFVYPSVDICVAETLPSH